MNVLVHRVQLGALTQSLNVLMSSAIPANDFESITQCELSQNVSMLYSSKTESLPNPSFLQLG
jgi:hypothetical protein